MDSHRRICRLCLEECAICRGIERDLWRTRMQADLRVRKKLEGVHSYCPLGSSNISHYRSNLYPEFELRSPGTDYFQTRAQRRRYEPYQSALKRKLEEGYNQYMEKSQENLRDIEDDREDLRRTFNRIENRINEIEASLSDHAQTIKKETEEIDMFCQSENGTHTERKSNRTERLREITSMNKGVGTRDGLSSWMDQEKASPRTRNPRIRSPKIEERIGIRERSGSPLRLSAKKIAIGSNSKKDGKKSTGKNGFKKGRLLGSENPNYFGVDDNIE